MANTCKYRLHAKYENIPLEFGSPILVNNSNITDEYALKLLQHKNGERYFTTLPDPNAPAEEPIVKKKKRKRIVKPKPAPSINEADISEISSEDEAQ